MCAPTQELSGFENEMRTHIPVNLNMPWLAQGLDSSNPPPGFWLNAVQVCVLSLLPYYLLGIPLVFADQEGSVQSFQRLHSFSPTFQMIFLLQLKIGSISLWIVAILLFLPPVPTLCKSKGPTSVYLPQPLALYWSIKNQLGTRTFSIWTHRFPIESKLLNQSPTSHLFYPN